MKHQKRYSQIFTILVIVITLLIGLTLIQLIPSQWNSQYENINRPKISLDNLINKYVKQFNHKVKKPFSKLLSAISLENVPKRVQLNDSQMFRLVEKETNLAASYWHWWKNSSDEQNITKFKPNIKYCKNVQLTSPIKVRHNNLHWQLFDAVSTNQSEETVKMFLYNAYFDDRIKEAPVVKLVTMNKQELLGNGRNWSCLLWFDNVKSPALVKVSEYYNIWPEYWKIKYGVYHPQLISCPIPKEYYGEIPRAISLQNREKCEEVEKEPSNVLRVIHNARNPTFKNRSIGICVQAFRFGTYDVSVRLVEWLEMVRLLGADRVYFYVHGMTDIIQQVLAHYQKDGLVDWRPLTLPGEQVNINSLYNTLAFKAGENFWPSELIELNDCLYQNIYRHDYLAVIDIDEIIMPQKVNTWQELIEQIENGLSAYNLKHHGYYASQHSQVCEVFEETKFKPNSANSIDETIPEFLYMSRHTHRANVLTYNQHKCFHRTDRVIAVHNHFPMRCIDTTGWLKCPGMIIDQRDSVLMHYRRNTSNPKLAHRNADCPVHDRSVWRYYDEMRDRVKSQLEDIFG